MLGESEAKRLIESVLEFSKADQTEVSIIASTSSLTRFANNGIHQNVSEKDARIAVRTVIGKKVGVASTNQLDLRAIRTALDRAIEITRLQEENADFVSLPGPTEIQPVESCVTKTITYSPLKRAEAVRVICRKARDFELVASGTFETSLLEIAIGNSLGVSAYHAGTSAGISAVVMSEDSAGYADYNSADVAELDVEAVGDEAIDRALRSRGPTEVQPGEYEVVLEEYAVADILETLAYLGFGALAVQEDRSFMNGKFGTKVASGLISIWDDGLSSDGLPMPFDFEGVGKKHVDLISRGIAEGVVYDSYTAFREGKQSTGHALPAPNTYGPMPMNMFMAPGHSSKEEMIRSVAKGILVTRFHYTNPVHPVRTIVTGMTRDGTFLIENGEVTRSLKNLRFTESYLGALDRVLEISSTSKLEAGFMGGIKVPALRIGSFRFTGITEF